MPLPRPMATRVRPDAAASFAASRRAPDFRFRLPRGRAHAHVSRLPSREEAGLSARPRRCAPIGPCPLTR